MYAFWERWNGRGLPLALIRLTAGAAACVPGPHGELTACIVDSQIVKAADTVGRATSGYHGGKKIRHSFTVSIPAPRRSSQVA